MNSTKSSLSLVKVGTVLSKSQQWTMLRTVVTTKNGQMDKVEIVVLPSKWFIANPDWVCKIQMLDQASSLACSPSLEPIKAIRPQAKVSDSF